MTVRHQGRITEWKDDRGFGFVTPNGGGQKVFVHISSFINRQRRPVGGELVTYDLTVDARGRPQAMQVRFTDDQPKPDPVSSPPGPGNMALYVAFAFLLCVAGIVIAGRLPFPVLLLYLGASCVCYLAYAFDKAAALKGRWRTPEATLHFLSLAGGWPGALLAQKSFRHETRKLSFRIAFWGTVLLNCTLLVGFFLNRQMIGLD